MDTGEPTLLAVTFKRDKQPDALTAYRKVCEDCGVAPDAAVEKKLPGGHKDFTANIEIQTGLQAISLYNHDNVRGWRVAGTDQLSNPAPRLI